MIHASTDVACLLVCMHLRSYTIRPPGKLPNRVPDMKMGSISPLLGSQSYFALSVMGNNPKGLNL